MAYSEQLAERIRSILAPHTLFSERKMFGGVAFMVDGNMCCGIIGDQLMARVGPAAYEEALAQPHVREMDFSGRPMKGMIYVDPAGVVDDAAMEGWIAKALAYVRTLPSK